MKNCIDCNKELRGHHNPKRCKSCANRIKAIKHGYYMTKHYCKDCGKEVTGHSNKTKYCRHCMLLGKRNHRFGKHFTEKQKEKIRTLLVKHHIDCNHYNEQKSNLIYLIHSRHMKAHGSLNKLVAELLNRKVIKFDKKEGIYKLRYS